MPASRRSPRSDLDALRRAAWEPLLRIIQHERTRWLAVWPSLGLTAPQGFTLLNLVRRGPGPMSALAEALQCDASNITGLVDKLEARGLIERRPDPQDRRVKVLAVTPAGHELYGQIQQRIGDPPEFLLGLTRSELAALAAALAKLPLLPTPPFATPKDVAVPAPRAKTRRRARASQAALA